MTREEQRKAKEEKRQAKIKAREDKKRERQEIKNWDKMVDRAKSKGAWIED